MIPDFKALLAKRAGDPALNDEALRVYFARGPNPQFKTRDDIVNSPLLGPELLQVRRSSCGATLPRADAARYGEYLKAREQLMINILKVMADNRLDAIVHKTVEHQPTLIKDGINPPYVTQRGVPSFNTFLAYSSVITVPSGFTTDNLPVGHHVLRPALQRAHASQARLRLRAGDASSRAAQDDAAVGEVTRFYS